MLAVVPIMFLRAKENPRSRVIFCVSSFLCVLLIQNICFVFLCLPWAWCFWSVQASYLVECLSVWLCPVFLTIWIMHFWQKNPRSDIIFSVHNIKKHIMLICTLIGDVNFGHLFRWDLSDFTTIKLLFFRL